MKNNFIHLLTDQSLRIGFMLLLVSALLYGLAFSSYEHYDDGFTPLFFVHYGIALFYFLYLSVRRKLRLFSLFRKESKDYHFILLMLFNISAYSLNQSLPVFHSSVTWLMVFLIIENCLLVLYILFPPSNKIYASILLFLLTIALVFNIYQALMIFPYMALGIMASPFLGISLHVLVPPLYVFAILSIMKPLTKSGADWKPLAIGITCCLLVISICVVQWSQVNHKIEAVHHQMHVPGAANELPEWVRLAQTLPDNSFTEKALQSGLVYQEFRPWDSFFGSGLRFENTKFHDPLVTIASFFNGEIDLDETTKIKILDAIFNMRHESADRFWSGLNLKTNNIITNVQLYPAYRLAYTEMILSISNDAYEQGSGWFSQEEALYTFQLPEGGTVSSLSLWIEGIEAKARLTTKSKAEKAYNTIVGREMRDPSVVYWMEGNKIRVRVFPCTPKEGRQFKIGITSPLIYKKETLVYNNITFKGPDFEEADVSINILIEDSKEPLKTNLALQKQGNIYSWSGAYPPNWSISTKAVPLAKMPFNFQDTSYSIQELPIAYDYFHAEHLYLDLHSGWEVEDIKALAPAFANRKVYIYNYRTGSMEQPTVSAIIQTIEDGNVPQFSLFPFQKVQFPGRSLVITKGNKATPNLSDIRETAFCKDLFNHLDRSTQIRVFDLCPSPSDYLRSLKEFKVLQYKHGTPSELKALLTTKRFPVVASNADTLAIEPAGIMILKTKATEQGSMAPDHLLRLFSYNQVMKDIGRNYFKEEYLNEDIIKTAALGNVVTPISSLIVLETLKDYKRFEIDENKDSLGNASINSSGAVPEPHEWALIILGSLFVLWMWLVKSKKLSKI